jgi:hypothetical protein
MVMCHPGNMLTCDGLYPLFSDDKKSAEKAVFSAYLQDFVLT